MIETAIQRVLNGKNLEMDEMASAIGAIMDGGCDDAEIATLLTGLRSKGETVTEIAGAAKAMRDHMTPIRSGRDGLLDTCGTGGGGSGTFNISTAAALVAAAAGAPVAKHGNRGITSKSGSADVLAALGVNIDAEVSIVENCLDQLGFCFCFAPKLHASMRHVAPVRKKLGVRTIFNLLGPLSNPASAPFQLLGVPRPEIGERLAEALVMLGTQRVLVVCGSDGLGEVTLAGSTTVIEATGKELRRFHWTPADFDLGESSLDSIQVDGPTASAAMVNDVLAGREGTAREIVIANAAAALYAARMSESLVECTTLAAHAIDCGAARGLLARLVELSNTCAA